MTQSKSGTYEVKKQFGTFRFEDNYHPSSEHERSKDVHGLDLGDLENNKATVVECIRHIKVMKHSIEELESRNLTIVDKLEKITSEASEKDTKLQLAIQENDHLKQRFGERTFYSHLATLIQLIGAVLLGFVPFIYTEIPDEIGSRGLIAIVVAIFAVALLVIPIFAKKGDKL